MKKLYSPQNEIELSLIKSIFDAEKIDYFVQNDHFGSLQIGPSIELFNQKNILVSEAHFERASEILADFLKNIGGDQASSYKEYSLFDKLRMIVEFLLFGWIVPGKRSEKKKKT